VVFNSRAITQKLIPRYSVPVPRLAGVPKGPECPGGVGCVVLYYGWWWCRILSYLIFFSYFCVVRSFGSVAVFPVAVLV